MSIRNPSYPRSNVLVLGSSSIHSLLPSTLTSQAEALLEAHRIEDAVKVAEQFRRKMQSKPHVSVQEVSTALHFTTCRALVMEDSHCGMT